MITMEVNASQLVVNAKHLERAVQAGIPKSLFDVAFEVMRLSQRQVPHDEGTLQNSGTVEDVGLDVVAGYHTPYAARLHEHPEYRFQKGRKGKYLEDPIRQNAKVLGLVFGKGLQRRAF